MKLRATNFGFVCLFVETQLTNENAESLNKCLGNHNIIFFIYWRTIQFVILAVLCTSVCAHTQLKFSVDFEVDNKFAIHKIGGSWLH